jgi:triphosphoribosyl-dephospho-CoA synthase
MNTTQAPCLDAGHVTAIIRNACETEVRAFKPGNVSIASPGHGMRAEDFLRSADAAIGAMSEPGVSVGERILAAIEATRRVVPFNTNLGIVLLCAPLMHCAIEPATSVLLRQRLAAVLRALTVDDARLAYRAIRLAQPGGMGKVERQDLSQTPTVSLLDAMREAGARDRIASQYETVYADIFELGLPTARRFLARWKSRDWTAVAVYLKLLSSFPDSLVARKFGAQVADAVRGEAGEAAACMEAARNPEEVLPALERFDTSLKLRSINPGTSADLTVATLVAMDLEEAFAEGSSE